MIRCWSSALTPFLFTPSLLQIICRVLLSMPEFFTNRARGSASRCPPPIEAIVGDLRIREGLTGGPIHKDERRWRCCVVLRCAAWVSAKDGSGGHSLCLASHSQRADFYHAVKLYSLFHTRPFTLDVGGFPTRLVTNPSPKEVTAFAEKKVCACGACQNISRFLRPLRTIARSLLKTPATPSNYHS
jgi:hypothetical protein